MYEELNAVWNEQIAPGQMFEVVTIDVRGVPTRSFTHAPNSLREFWLSAAAYGDREYLIYEDERITYAQAHNQSAAVANWLHLHGVKPGDRVAIAMRNYPEWMLAYWAITSMGAVAVGMNAWWVPQEIEYALQDSEPKVLICDRERLERFEEVRDKFPNIATLGVRLGGAHEGTTPWSDAIAAEPVLPEVSIDPESDACIFYTSGTTGKPKGAQLTHRGCTSNIMNLAFVNSVAPIALARSKGEEPPVQDSSKQLCALLATPLFHVTANNCVAQLITMVGGKLVHTYKWNAADALRIIEKEQVTTFSAVPMMSREMLLHPDFATRDTSSLQSIGGGGAAVQPDLVAKLEEGTKNARPGAGYGMTETCGIIAACSGDYLLDKPASVGRAVPTLEAKCVDDDGNTVAVGERGELWVRGAPVIKGYLNRPNSMVDGWLETGDIAYIDETEFIFLVDRKKEMVLRGGENVYCAEVENTLFAHDCVAECVVIPVPDERLGEEVGAAIYLKEGSTVTPDELRAFCKDQLAAYKIPRYIWIVDQALPRNANGKFVKREVQDSLELADAG
ncbi:MAG: acyl-CoA synthetase (AMP-forming)/AMP-acid ligase II [Halioglobus sp.]|jgi:acyl-CoA synthetase (AMP-forming)/AMP-acid ligase II